MGTEWSPQYEAWRHGGWYVTNVRYPSGACGCVSRNFSDKKWRIVCSDAYPGSPADRTFPNRDAAARAELEVAEGQFAQIRGSLSFPYVLEALSTTPVDVLTKLATYAHTDEAVRVAARDALRARTAA